MENQPTNFDQPIKPNNYLALAIVSTVLCCLPAGIVSIVYSTKVNSEYHQGNYAEAERASKNAKTWGIVAIGIALLGWIVYIAFFGLAFLGALGSGY